MIDPDVANLCAGKSDLFDSIDPADHEQAKQLCDECPAINLCRSRLAAARELAYDRANGPVGTWAGEFLAPRATIRPSVSRKILAAEENAYTDQQALEAHRAWVRGEENDWIRTGERVYQRRQKRRSNARKRAAAA